MKHVPRVILQDLVKESLTEAKKAEVRSHLAECPRCAREFSFVNRIISPSFNFKKAVPPKKIFSDVLAYYDSVTTHKKPALGLLDLATRRLRYTIAASGAIAAIFISGFLYIEWKYENRPVQASHVKGYVKANKAYIHKGHALQPGDYVITGEDSKIALVLGKLMKLNAGPDTSMYISKSYLNRKTGKTTVEIVIKRGTILAVFDKTGKMKFIFRTPHGSISSLGSSIAMKVGPEKTRIVVKDGSAKLAPSNGYSIRSLENQTYSITPHKVITADDTPDDDDDITALGNDDDDNSSSGDHSVR